MKVGIFGGGVVGGGVYEIISKCMKSGKFPGVGANIEISKIWPIVKKRLPKNCKNEFPVRCK